MQQQDTLTTRHDELLKEAPEKRAYSSPKLEAFGTIRSATLGLPSPIGESGQEGTHHT